MTEQKRAVPSQARVVSLIKENPNMSVRDLLEIAGLDGDKVIEGRFKDAIKVLEKKGKIKRSEEKRFCFFAGKPVWTWTVVE